MKTISSRFLKGALAMLLAVVMLFGTTLTGFAAVVDKAETSGTNWKGKIYFKAPQSWNLTTNSNVQVVLTQSSSASSGTKYAFVAGKMTKVTNSDRLYYYSISADHSSWGTEYIAFIANSSSWNTGDFYINTCAHYTKPLRYDCNNSSNYYLFKASTEAYDTGSTTNNLTMAGSYNSSRRTVLNEEQLVNLTNNGTASSAVGTVKIAGYYDSADTTVTSSSATSSGTSVKYSDAAIGSKITLTATPASGYKFVGYYSGTTLLSSSTSYSYTVYAGKTIEARFATNGYSYTVSAGTGGTVNTTGGTGTTATVKATPSAGYAFDKWELGTGATQTSTSNSGGVETGNFNITANGATIKATFKKLTYTVTFKDADGTVLDTQTVEYGTSATAPDLPTKEGYTSSWDKAYSNITGNTTVTVVYTANPYSVAVSADPTAGGTVKINGSTTTPQTVSYDKEVTVTATANKGYKFLGWYENGSTLKSSNASYTFTCKGNISLVAKFELETYTISTAVSPENAGTATVDKTSVKYGEEVTLTAVANDGYRFHSWQINGRDVAFTADFTVAPEADATYTATFEKVWNLTVVVPTGVDTVSFSTTGTSTTHTYPAIADGLKNTYSAKVETGYKLVGWEVTKNGETETFDTPTVEVIVDADTTITPVVEKLYYAIVAGDTATADDYYEAGETVTLTFDVPDAKYLTGVTVAPAMELDVDINKDAGSVTFTMPENNVTLTPQYGDMYKVEFSADIFTSTTNKGYYYPGQAVTIEVTPKGGHVITAVTSEQTDVTYANKVITFTMPAENVTLVVEYSASFKAYSDVITVHIDNPNHSYDPVDGGTVKMTCNGTTLADGGFADGDVTYTATPKTDYTFVGFYSDYDCNKFITDKTTYTVSPESDVTVYALFARKQYIRISGHSFREMAFDRTLKAYTMVYTLDGEDTVGTAPIDQKTFNDGFDFDVHYNKNATEHAYHGYGSTFTTEMNKNSYARTVSWGSSRWHVSSAQSNTSFPLTIIVKPESVHVYNKIDVSARAQKTGATVFLSDGRYLNYNASTTILTEGVTGTDKVIGHDGDSEEYKVINLSEFKTLSWETTINHEDAKYLYVDSYIVYKLESKTWEIVAPVSLGNNKYQGSVFVNGDCYIVPIFFYNDDYCTDKGYVNIDLYFDASAIQNLNWGPFVAAYAWGSDNKAYFGSWPGQLLIPTEDGKSFFTQMTVPKVGSDDPAAGVTFNNYMYNTCPVQESGVFGLSTSNVQTYDYREVITLYESGFDVITFVAKDSKDGYHGDYSDGSHTSNKISSSVTGVKTKYTFDYLYCRDGVTPMDFTGKPVTDTENATVKNLDSADYYVVAKGDVDYNKGDYSGDDQYNGNWSVDWYIFDTNGTYKTKVLSTALWHDLDTTDDVVQTVLMTALGLTPETAAGKTVAISYDAPNNCPQNNSYKDGKSHQIAYDGQWYGNMLDDDVTGQVIVGLDDGNGNFTIDTLDPINEADYGSGYLKDLEGGLHQTLDIKLDYGIADLTATAGKGYRFIGWYTRKADGTYVQINTNTSYSTYINMNETYYAIFRELGEEEVVINHRKYVNDDPAIMSHDGVGEMSIEVLDSTGKVVANGPISTSGTSAAFEAIEGQTYTIKITTTPLMKGKFFAWYTDSKRADGTATYEEVLTEEEHRDSTSTVETTFEYTYDSTDPTLQKNITIYSDVRRVSNKATIVYSYFNRFNILCTYTIKDVALSDEECTGKTSDGKTFAGNDGREYVPTYRTLVTFILPDGKTEWSNYFPAETVSERIAEYESEGYTFVSSYNKIQAYAPDANVTEAFNDKISWIIEDQYISPEESVLRVKANQELPLYTVYYTMPNEDGDLVTEDASGEYNTLMKITAPSKNKDGEKFSYWYEPATGEILCYTTYYNYKIVENKTIVAVYGQEIEQEWTPSINSVTYTREFSDNNDFVYTDYLLAFNNKDSKILTEVYEDEGIEYGLLVFRDRDYYIEDANNITYPTIDATVEDYLKRVARDKKQNMAIPVDKDNNKYYNCYYYNLTGNNLTIFNRCDYFVRYYNDYQVAEGKYYRDYALTAVAYIIVDGEVYLSSPKNVNFYELGNMPVTSTGNN